MRCQRMEEAGVGDAQARCNASCLFQSSWGRLSPRSWQPATTSSAASCGPTYLVTPTSVMSSALRPADSAATAIRSRTRRRLSAMDMGGLARSHSFYLKPFLDLAGVEEAAGGELAGDVPADER